MAAGRCCGNGLLLLPLRFRHSNNTNKHLPPSSSRFSSSGPDRSSDLPRKKSSKPPSPSDPASPSPDPDTFLLDSLKKELKDTSYLVNKYQNPFKGSFKPFEVVPNVDASDLTLCRKFGDEEVLVECILDIEEPQREDDHSEDEDDEPKFDQRLTLKVRISKGPSEDGPRLSFICSYDRSESIVIDDIAYLRKSSFDNNTYSGPCFTDLNANIKQAFQNVIKARGIKTSLADHIIDYLTGQYQADYIKWLQNIRSFLKR